MIKINLWQPLQGLFALIVVLFVPITTAAAESFDHQHQLWSETLTHVVQVKQEGAWTRVDYELLTIDSDSFVRYLEQLSRVDQSTFDSWSQSEQLSFLINAYNAFTLELIRSNYQEFSSGNADSIRDLGTWFNSPWELEFYTLLGAQRTLDWLEHEVIRPNYAEPRIHAALVCAAISCPPLQNSAYTAAELDRQLDQQMTLFLNDPANNRYDADEQTLYLSSIFKWYGDDFLAHQNYQTLHDVAQRYMNNQALDEAVQARTSVAIRFLDYDWKLNRTN